MTDTLEVQGQTLHSDSEGDVYEVACGLYWHCADYHEGQWSERYRILSTLGFTPSALQRGPDDCSIAADVYEALEENGLDLLAAEQFVRSYFEG